MEWGGVGGVGGDKNHPLGHPMSSHDAYTVANNICTSGPHSQWEQIQVPTVQLAPSMGPIVPAMTLEGWRNALEKSRPVNL